MSGRRALSRRSRAWSWMKALPERRAAHAERKSRRGCRRSRRRKIRSSSSLMAARRPRSTVSWPGSIEATWPRIW